MPWASQQVQNLLPEVVRLERFSDEGVGTTLVGPSAGFLLCVRGEDQHGEVFGAAIRAKTIEDFWRIRRDDAMRDALLEDDWLPVQHGVLITYLKVHENNELFGTEPTILVGELWPFRKKSRRITSMAQDSRFTSVEDNLLWFEERCTGFIDDPDSARSGNLERLVV